MIDELIFFGLGVLAAVAVYRFAGDAGATVAVEHGQLSRLADRIETMISEALVQPLAPLKAAQEGAIARAGAQAAAPTVATRGPEAPAAPATPA